MAEKVVYNLFTNFRCFPDDDHPEDLDWMKAIEERKRQLSAMKNLTPQEKQAALNKVLEESIRRPKQGSSVTPG